VCAPSRDASHGRWRARAACGTLGRVFERFTDGARQVVVLAQHEARTLGHDHVGTEHILLGLLGEEEGVARQVLLSLDVTLDEVRAQVAGIVGQGETLATGQIPFTPRAKKVLELALREALSLGQNDIGTEHVLLGLARESHGVANQILLDHGVDAAKIRDKIVRLLPESLGTGQQQEGRMPPFVQRALGRHMPPAEWPVRWEYRVVSVEAAALGEELLGTYGEDGWELAAALPLGGAVRLVFKKPA
jgi:ATP-dependent Clp protease ATP-binding subunit ClpA